MNWCYPPVLGEMLRTRVYSACLQSSLNNEKWGRKYINESEAVAERAETWLSDAKKLYTQLRN